MLVFFLHLWQQTTYLYFLQDFYTQNIHCGLNGHIKKKKKRSISQMLPYLDKGGCQLNINWKCLEKRRCSDSLIKIISMHWKQHTTHFIDNHSLMMLLKSEALDIWCFLLEMKCRKSQVKYVILSYNLQGYKNLF